MYEGLSVLTNMCPSTSYDLNWLYDVGKAGKISDLPFL